MIVGTVKEIKTHEYRVEADAGESHELHVHGHQVVVEAGAGPGHWSER